MKIVHQLLTSLTHPKFKYTFECLVGQELQRCRDVGDSSFVDFNVSKYLHFKKGLGEGMMVGGGHQRLFQVGETQKRWQRSLKISL